MVDPSTAMFFAAAPVKATAPCTLWMTWLLLEEVSEFDLVSLVARLAVVEVALVSVSLLLWVVEEFLADCCVFALVLLELDARCEASFALCELALWAALLAAELVVELADLAAFEDELTFDAELSVEADWLALFAVVEAVLDLPLVELLADPLLVVERLSDPVPTVDDVAPKLVPLLLFVELPTAEALPGLVEAAVAPVALAADVLLLVFDLLADALSVEEADLTLLAVDALFAAEASVAEFVLLALFEAELVLFDEEVLLALACWVAFLFELELFEALLLVVKLFVLVSLLLFVWLKEALRVFEELFVSVSFCERVASVWLFVPRL
jgi:hypothetical protein